MTSIKLDLHLLVITPASEPAGTYELYVADYRFVLLKTQPRTSSWAAGGGLLGAAIASGMDRARKKTYDPDAPLDTKIGLDKHNYVLPYNRIQRITMSKGMQEGAIKGPAGRVEELERR